MASLMITEYWCMQVGQTTPYIGPTYTMLYALSNEFDHVGGIKEGEDLICDSSTDGERWRVVNITRAIFKDPDVPSEKAYLDTVKKVTGVIKTPFSDITEDETDDEESAAPSAD